MGKIKKYESAKLELIYLEESDIITTSSPDWSDSGSGSSGLFDKDGWT